MSFSDELSKIFNLDTLAKTFSLQILNDEFVVIEGVRKVLEISKTEIFIENVLNRKVKVLGRDFVVSRLEKNELCVRGTLEAVQYV